jgi:hypothetical protein
MFRTSWRARRHFALFLRFSTGMALIAALAPAAAHALDTSTPIEIPRPSRNWTPDGYKPVPEAMQLQEVVRLGLAPHAASGLTQAQRSLDGGPRNIRFSIARQALAALTAKGDVRAEVAWDENLGVPHRVRAAGIRVTGFDLRSQAGVEAAARSFIRDHADLLTGGEHPTPADMPLEAAHRVGELWLLVFGQRWHGYDVVDGRVDVRMRTDGSIPVFGSSWFAGAGAASDQPGMSVTAAYGVGRAGLALPSRTVKDLGADLALLPVDAEEGIGFRLVHRVRQSTDDPAGQWTTYVDANDGRVWARENRTKYVTATGNVSGAILPYTYTDPFVTANMKHAVVWRAADSTYADANGNFSLANSTPGESLYTAFRSPYLEILNAQGRVSYLGGVVPPSGPINFSWTPSTSDTAERNLFYQALQAHDYTKVYDPAFTGMDYRVPGTINIAATCNAYWDGFGINFYAFGGSCPNTADIADVIFHEYRHGITQYVWGNGNNYPNDAMNEGLSDYYAATMKRNPIIGLNFFGPGTQIRSVLNNKVMPANECNGEVHCVGLCVSGALWDMQSNFIAALADSNAGHVKADSLYHYAGYGEAFWFDDYFLDLLALADNDGTLLNGTPYYTQICSAMTAHGFTCPDTTSGPWIVHTPLPDSDPTTSPFTVDANMGSFASTLAPGGQNIHFRYNGGPWDESPMNLVSGAHYQGQFPAPPAGGRVDYYLENRDNAALTMTSPGNAPSAFNTFWVGSQSAIFADDMEIDRGWIPTNTATTGRWQRVVPTGTSEDGFQYSPATDHTPDPGTMCWVTGDTTAGLPPGTDDVDNGCVQLLSPRWDLTGLSNARLSWWRWYTDETIYNDTLYFDISSDDGATWVPLSNVKFTHNEWIQDSFSLNGIIPFTNTVRMRVLTCDQGGQSLLEAAFDDVLLSTRTYSLVAAPPPRISHQLALEDPYPMPSAGPTTVFFTLPGTDGATVHASLRLYDARGRLVRTLRDGDLPAGRTSATWDGADGSGRHVGAGTYLLRLEAGRQWASEKLVLTR